MNKWPIVSLLVLGGCQTCPQSPPRIETVQVVKEVQRPCPITIPTRPSKLATPLPSDLERLAATLASKLMEYTAPGGYADRAEAALRTCVGK